MRCEKKMLNDTQLFTFIWIKGRLIFNLRKFRIQPLTASIFLIDLELFVGCGRPENDRRKENFRILSFCIQTRIRWSVDWAIPFALQRYVEARQFCTIKSLLLQTIAMHTDIKRLLKTPAHGYISFNTPETHNRRIPCIFLTFS